MILLLARYISGYVILFPYAIRLRCTGTLVPTQITVITGVPCRDTADDYRLGRTPTSLIESANSLSSPSSNTVLGCFSFGDIFGIGLKKVPAPEPAKLIGVTLFAAVNRSLTVLRLLSAEPKQGLYPVYPYLFYSRRYPVSCLSFLALTFPLCT